MGEPPVIHNHVQHRNLNIAPFIPDEDPSTRGYEWEKWLKRLERQLDFFQITDAEDKKNALLIYGGEHVEEIEDTQPDPANPGEGATVYTKVKQKLNEYFLPRKNKIYSRYLFNKMKQSRTESVLQYSTWLREAVKYCEYTNSDEMILDKLVCTVRNKELRQKAFVKDWTLTQFLDYAIAAEETKTQAKEIDRDVEKDVHIKEELDVKKMRYGKSSKRESSSRIKQHESSSRVKQHKTKHPSQEKQQKKYVEWRNECYKCGYRHAPTPEACPAKDEQCIGCGMIGHFIKMCRNTVKNKKAQVVKKHQWAEPEESDSTASDASEEYDDDLNLESKMVRHFSVKKAAFGKTNKLVTVLVNDTPVEMDPDSGSDASIVDEKQYGEILKKSSKPKQFILQETRNSLNCIKYKIPVKGSFYASVKNKTRQITTEFIVVEGEMKSAPLLGYNDLVELGMIKIDPEGKFKEPNIDVRCLSTQQELIQEITDKYASVFQGIGKIVDPDTKKELLVTLPIDKSIQPVALKPRPIPYHLEDKAKARLDELQTHDIIEDHPPGEPIGWCSPMGVSPKPKNPADVRLWVDQRVANTAMKRTSTVPAPVIEDFTTEFNDCTIFSKVDMNHGYHQAVLHPESRSITTFSTPWGNKRFKRLNFGTVASQDEFDSMMRRILSGIPRCRNNRDDILIGGRTPEEHAETLETVLKRLSEHGITLNKEKCQFGVSEIEFFGHTFSSTGLKPSREKVAALKNCTRPTSKEGVRSFLGMAGWLQRFIPNYAILTAPLRRLTEKNETFEWTSQTQKAYDMIKNSLSEETIMTYYRKDRQTMLTIDGAKGIGLCGILSQKTKSGWRPVHYVSRSLSSAEKRYSQTETEALAAQWACQRLGMYLVGHPNFTIQTDCKPLLPLFNKPTSSPPPRIERFIMKMQNFNYTMIYSPGKENIADYLSRHSATETRCTNSVEKDIKAMVMTEHAIILQDFQKHTKMDEELQTVTERIQKNDWDDYKNHPHILPYWNMRYELYMCEDMILRYNKIIVPKALRKQVVSVAHRQGHQGTNRTRQMIRQKYWFPDLNKLVDDEIKACLPCQAAVNINCSEPLKMSELPTRPWDCVAADYCGPFYDGYYAFSIIDEYSRYPEVMFTTTTSFKALKPKLKAIFATYGVPRILKTDNGPPFNSENFERFAQETGFHHRRTTPEHPQSNGAIEAFNKVIEKTARIAQVQHTDYKVDIQDTLMAYRATPHPATGYPPYALMFNREVRTNLDHLPTTQPPQDPEVRRHDAAYKAKIKSYGDKRRSAKPRTIAVGDTVLVKQRKQHKLMTPFEPNIYIVLHVYGSTIVARRVTDGRQVKRDLSQFKLFKYKTLTYLDKDQKGENEREDLVHPKKLYRRLDNPREQNNIAPAPNVQAPPAAQHANGVNIMEGNRKYPGRDRQPPKHHKDYVKHSNK